MMHGVLIPPHHLFESHPAIDELSASGEEFRVLIVEEFLFFRQYTFHKQKLAYHRATMSYYADLLRKRGINVEYYSSNDERSDIRMLIAHLAEHNACTLHCCDVTDNWLERRITTTAAQHGLNVKWYGSPMFLNSRTDITRKLTSRTRLFQTDFYIAERKERGILLDAAGKPHGGSWTYDADNRKRYPKGAIPPQVKYPVATSWWRDAVRHVESQFPDNYGFVDAERQLYPITHHQAAEWLDGFLETRFTDFGIYEDAIVHRESILHHSVLTPMLNIGLLTPDYVVKRTLDYAALHTVPVNSLEGFIRQIIGWREFIRGVYELKGTEERTHNFWQCTRSIPPSFWSGTTGIVPIDNVVAKVLSCGYAHHIERLMVAGNFMLLCEFHPDAVHRWFMELFIDAYDWVMVPNVYGMSQFADGGLMSTKPYISGSNYLVKMGDYPKGGWQQTWDALFWRFMDEHRDFFGQNPRLGMLLKTFDAMPDAKKALHRQTAAEWMKHMDGDTKHHD